MRRRVFISSALALPLVAIANDVDNLIGPNHKLARPQRKRTRPPAAYELSASVLRWNQIALDATGLDHTPVLPGEERVYGEQLGPCRASRAIAMAHLAVYNAMTAAHGRHVAQHACVAQAASDMLVGLFPSQAATFLEALAEDLAIGGDAEAISLGVRLGQDAARALEVSRTGDGAEIPDPLVNIDWVTNDSPGHWQQDPISRGRLALGAYWGSVTPFVLRSGSQLRVPSPPDLTSQEYRNAFREAATLGGDGITTSTLRTPEQAIISTFWAYDGTPSLCAPPRLYNQVARTIAALRNTDGFALLRLLTLVNVALADTAIATWESKYYFDFWRPVTAIRDAGSQPTQPDDETASIVAGANWTPLGAPASNLTGPNFTPPFPAYPSGHAAFGGALFEILRKFYGTDDIAFTFTSDEFNGVTRDNSDHLRPLVTRSYPTLSAAEEENGQSRIYLGIHWHFDKSHGISQGRRVANHVFRNFA